MSDILRENKLKRTKCRIAVLAYLGTAQGPVTAEGLYQALSSSGTIHTSLSTVYRTVGALSEKGLLLKSAGADGVIHYQLNNSRHCHYLICTDCSQVVPVDGCPLHVLEESLSQSTGYHITGHHLEFFGLCPQCASGRKNRRRCASPTMNKTIQAPGATPGACDFVSDVSGTISWTEPRSHTFWRLPATPGRRLRSSSGSSNPIPCRRERP